MKVTSKIPIEEFELFKELLYEMGGKLITNPYQFGEHVRVYYEVPRFEAFRNTYKANKGLVDKPNKR